MKLPLICRMHFPRSVGFELPRPPSSSSSSSGEGTPLGEGLYLFIQLHCRAGREREYRSEHTT